MSKTPPTNVPQIDAGSSRRAGSGSDSGGGDIRFRDIELRLLDAGAKAKEDLNREADQRFWLRNLAIFVCICLIVFMATLLWHGGYHYFSGDYSKKPPVHIVAIYIAPIISMTTVTIAVLVAAFRGYKDADVSDGIGAATSAAKSGILGN